MGLAHLAHIEDRSPIIVLGPTLVKYSYQQPALQFNNRTMQ
jgi:hypothetical protein